MRLSSQTIQHFQNTILLWYSQHQRDLPWRKTRDPYAILVSEVMLQQTQVARVISKYEAWLAQFPTLIALANASVRDVLRVWSGLGYNRRALNLQKAAQIIVERYKESFPQTVEALVKLPGIGTYTASAIACFAFDKQVPVIDTNVRKVILIEFCQNHPELIEGSLEEDSGVSFDKLRIPRMTEKEIEAIAWKILPKGRAYEWNQALMDYSRLVLKDKKILPRSGILLRRTKQFRFLSSDRYYRGQTIKVLLEVQKISFSSLLDYFKERNSIAQSRLESILVRMAKDGLIVRTGKTISLPEASIQP